MKAALGSGVLALLLVVVTACCGDPCSRPCPPCHPTLAPAACAPPRGADVRIAKADPTCGDFDVPTDDQGVSGIAFEEETSAELRFLVVHDAKNTSTKPRLARVRVSKAGGTLSYEEITGLAGSHDLEGLAAIPGRTGEYLAMESAGPVYHVAVASGATSATVTASFLSLPGASLRGDLEGMTVSKLGETLVIAWAWRGEGWTKPADLYLGTLDLSAKAAVTNQVGPFAVSVWDFPTIPPNTTDKDFYYRHVSGLTLRFDGTLFGTAAYDDDQKVPDKFHGRLCMLGGVAVDAAGKPSWKPLSKPTVIQTLAAPGGKVEAVDFLRGSTCPFALGTDNENGSKLFRR